MSKVESKVEIIQMLDTLSDKALQDLLVFLKQIHSKNGSSIFNVFAINQIMEEDNVYWRNLQNDFHLGVVYIHNHLIKTFGSASAV